MKKSLLVGLTLALVVATSAFAGLGLPKVNTGNSTVNNVVNKGVDMGKDAALEKIINDKLAKYNCAFKNDTTITDTTCDMNKVVSELTTWKGTLESTIASKVTVNVKASAKDTVKVKGSTPAALADNRAQEIRNRLYKTMSWWDYDVSSGTDMGNGLTISVSVK